jgi:3-oxoacyl-[acyl-carrier-protein] synthase-1
MALHLAAQRIAAGELEICVATGVDSYHDARTLAWLDRHGALMSEQNRNGFPPGEGAGACLIAARSFAEAHELPILARIKAAAIAREPHPSGAAGVCIGEGLTAALNGVSAALPQEQAITATYCDLNGQRYRNEEYLYALLRVQEVFVDAHDYECPADCWGDLGAASGPLFASLAICASERGYSKGPFPVAWAGSNSGYRTAVLLALESR